MGAVGLYQVMLLKEQSQGWVLMQIPGSPFCSWCFISPVSPLCLHESPGMVLVWQCWLCVTQLCPDAAPVLLKPALAR